MKIQKIFSNIENGEDKLYSVSMSEDEIKLYSQFQKEFTKAEKAVFNQFIKRTKNFRHMPGGQITDVKTANHLKSIAEKLSGKIPDKLTKEERKALKKIGLSEAAKPGVLDKIRDKYTNEEAWNRLSRRTGIKPEYLDRADTSVLRGKEAKEYQSIRGKNNPREKILKEKLAEKMDAIRERGEKSSQFYKNRYNHLLNITNNNSAEEQKAATMLKRFRRKHGVSVLETTKNGGEFSIKPRSSNRMLSTKGKLRDFEARDLISSDLEVLPSKQNIKQVKKLGIQNKNGLIVVNKSSSPAVIEHEIGHTRIKPAPRSTKPYSPSRKYNEMTNGLEAIAEENGASARSLENIRKIPGVDINKSKKELNAAHGTYMLHRGSNIINH